MNGFTGSSIWHLIYSFPPNDFAEIERGYEEFAERFDPIMDVFDAEGVRFGLEVHPTEIAYDFVTTRRALDAIGNRPAFGINLDPSHFAHQFLDTAQFALEFADRIYHVHVKDSKRRLDGRRSILGSHLNFGEEARGWDFVSPGHGDVDFEDAVPRAQPDRLRGAALDRVGGQRHGPRLGRRRRARVRPPDRLRPVGGGVRRRDAESRRVSAIGVETAASGGAGEIARDRRRHARLRVHGQGARERLPDACRTWRGRRRSGRGSSRSRAATRRAVDEAARRYGFERAVTDWHELVADPEVQLFDNSGPNNLHAEPTVAAAEAGKHVFCEKPLGAHGRRRATSCGSASRRRA